MVCVLNNVSQGEIEAGKLQVKNTDMKEKSIEAQIDKFDRDIDLADDAGI